MSHTSPMASCHCGISPNSVEIYSPEQADKLLSQIKNTLLHLKGKCDLCWKILGTDHDQEVEGRKEGRKEEKKWTERRREGGKE